MKLSSHLRKLVSGAALAVAALGAGAAQANETYSIGAGATSTTIYQWAAGMSDLINRNLSDATVSAEATAGVLDNHFLMNAGDIEFAISTTELSLNAYNGTGKFETFDEGRILSWMAMTPANLHIYARADAGIKTIEDLRGKRISLGQPGGSALVDGERLLTALGFDLDKDFAQVHRTQMGQQVDLMSNGQLDAGIWMGIPPLPALIRAVATMELTFLPISDEVLAKVMEKSPTYFKNPIAANTYAGQDEPIPSYSTAVMMVASEAVPEDVVYEITKVFLANTDYLESVHPALGFISPETVLSGMVTPLHPGAAKAYKELGIKGIDDYLAAHPLP